MIPGFAAAVTGLGLVTPAGVGVAENWRAVVDAVPAAADHPELAGLPVTIAGRVGELAEPARAFARSWQWDRYALFAVIAVHEALRQAGLEPGAWADPSRVAVVIGSGAGGTATLEAQYAELLAGGPKTVSPMTLPMGLLNMAAGQVAIEIGATGPCLAPCSACASGASAIGIGRDLIRSGAADVVIAGGAEAPITPLYLAAFARMKALSKCPDPAVASRPFDSARDGFVLAEGAGIMVLESERHAAARGAGPVARIVGYGASADAHHVTAPHPEGLGAKLAMRAALADAGAAPGDVGYVNAHGTSTPLNDVIEAAALREVFGDRVPVSSTKGVTGHPLGAAGAIEAVYTALAVRHGVLPPTANLADVDPRIDVDLILKAPRTERAGLALSNSFGFGGQNTALLVAA